MFNILFHSKKKPCNIYWRMYKISRKQYQFVPNLCHRILSQLDEILCVLKFTEVPILNGQFFLCFYWAYTLVGQIEERKYRQGSKRNIGDVSTRKKERPKSWPYPWQAPNIYQPSWPMFPNQGRGVRLGLRLERLLPADWTLLILPSG